VMTPGIVPRGDDGHASGQVAEDVAEDSRRDGHGEGGVL